MKKTILILMGVLAAGCAFADRTANRDWVGRNFAPSNLVPRVEAVENTLTNDTVQIGPGTNATAGTLQFRTWRIVGADGKIPKERLPSDGETYIPTQRDTWVNAGPLLLGADPVLLGVGVYDVGDPSRRSTWEVDSSCMYTRACWNFSKTVYISPDGVTIHGLSHLEFVIDGKYTKFADVVKSLITPDVVLAKIKAMNDTQKAELKAFLGIQ